MTIYSSLDDTDSAGNLVPQGLSASSPLFIFFVAQLIYQKFGQDDKRLNRWFIGDNRRDRHPRLQTKNIISRTSRQKWTNIVSVSANRGVSSE